MAVPEELQTLNSIDFLPDRYREAKVKRSANVWRLLVAVMFGVMLSLAAFYQQKMLWQAQHDLALAEGMHSKAMGLSQQISKAQADLAPTQNQAMLLTYLRHPWPRTQILSQLLGPLPEPCQILGMQIHFEIDPQPATAVEAAKPAEDPIDKTPSAARDLKRLRSELDHGHWIVSIRGGTTDVTALHAYVASLEGESLFSKVELVSIEAPASADSTLSQFSLKLTVRPGYGQPGGPSYVPAPAPIETPVAGGPA